MFILFQLPFSVLFIDIIDVMALPFASISVVFNVASLARDIFVPSQSSLCNCRIQRTYNIDSKSNLGEGHRIQGTSKSKLT